MIFSYINKRSAGITSISDSIPVVTTQKNFFSKLQCVGIKYQHANTFNGFGATVRKCKVRLHVFDVTGAIIVLNDRDGETLDHFCATGDTTVDNIY